MALGKRSSRVFVRIVSIICGTVLLGCGTDDAPDEGLRTIKIGAIFDLTGATADVGVDYADGVRGYVDWINAQGGIAGHTIDLLYQDYAYQVDRAEQLYSQFVQEGAVVFMGWGTGDTEALRLRIAEDQIPFSSASLSHVLGDAVESPYNFLAATTYSDQFKIVLRWIAEDYQARGGTGAPQVALMHSASPFGMSPWVYGGEAYATEIGVDVTRYEMSRGATDFTGEFTRIRQAGAEYVVFQNTSAPVAVAIRSARSLGIDATFVCLNWCANALLMRLVGEDAEGLVGAIPYAPLTADVPGVQPLRDYLEARGESYTERTNAYTQGWYTFSIFTEGIRRVIDAGQGLTGPNIKIALESIRDLDMEGVTVPITFTATDHRGSKGLRLFQVENGMWTPLTDFLTAP
jgi:branched-chain amino acid transport system substrate-binding protein